MISKEKQQWRLGREMLQERIELVKSEIESLEQKIADAEASITEADEKREELVSRNEALKEASSTLRATVAEFEGAVGGLLASAPEPAVQLVAPLSQRVPDDPRDTEMSLSERFQNVIGILNEMDKFNGKVTLTSEVRKLEDGQSAEVSTIYLGLGQGYYVGANNDLGGRGPAGGDGWSWTATNDAAATIADAISIYENQMTADFVPLPMAVRGEIDAASHGGSARSADASGNDTNTDEQGADSGADAGGSALTAQSSGRAADAETDHEETP